MDNSNPEVEASAPKEIGPPESDQNGDHALIVVGVGASAGGLEAFTELLRHVPATPGLAVVLVQHLDPHHESVLPGLLASKTGMPVVQVQNRTPVQANHLYVIPPNTVMRLRNRVLTLEVR